MPPADAPPPTRRSLRAAAAEMVDDPRSVILGPPTPPATASPVTAVLPIIPNRPAPPAPQSSFAEPRPAKPAHDRTRIQEEQRFEASLAERPESAAPEPDTQILAAPDPDEVLEDEPFGGGLFDHDDLDETALEPDAPRAAGATGGPVALAWIDDDALGAASRPTAVLDGIDSPVVPAAADLLANAPRRSPFRAGVLLPILVIASLFGGYAATTLLWPLHAVAPEITAVQVEPAAAPAAAPAWPAQGSAAIAVRGIPGTLSSSPDPASIASITKLVTALLVLEEMPLAVGEQGPEFRFSWNDRSQYNNYRWRGESALNVPVGESLTQYQMLQGMLIGSANNYADRLAGNLWPSDAVFARAARDWLDAHGVTGITIVEPTGFDDDNVATNEALLNIATKALANPVIAEIVATRAVDLPGAGHVENTNDLLADPGVVGLKTGTLDAYNLLSAKDVPIGDTTVRLYASVLGQPDAATRSAATRALYAQLEAELQPIVAVPAGTTAGVVETKWGERADVVTTEDAALTLWNGGAATVGVEYDLGDSRDKGDVVGSLTATGPFGAKTTSLALTADIEPPSAWWRLTHPLDLFGLTG